VSFVGTPSEVAGTGHPQSLSLENRDCCRAPCPVFFRSMNASPLRLYAEAAEYCWVKKTKIPVLAILLVLFSGCTQEPRVVASHPDRTEVVVADPIDAPMKPASEEAAEPAAFIYVKIPDGIGPLDRGEKYEDPLELKLAAPA